MMQCRYQNPINKTWTIACGFSPKLSKSNIRQMNRWLSILFITFFWANQNTFAQTEERTIQLSLEEVIKLAQEQSYDALIAVHRFRGSYWEYRSYVANLRPNLSISTDVLNYRNSINKIPTIEGDRFFFQDQNNSGVNLNLNQSVPITGGTFFMQSNLERIDDFLASKGEQIDYSSTPFQIGYQQPLFSFNSLKWERRIEPLRYEEARKQLIEDMEDVSIKALNFFFDLASSKINVEIAKLNFNNNDTLYKIAEGRFNIGTIAKNELLQMELNFLNSQSEMKQSLLDLEIKELQMLAFLGFNQNIKLELIVPKETPQAIIQYQDALRLASLNNQQMIIQQRQLLEAEREIDRARSQSRFQANLFTSYGLSDRGPVLDDVYRDLDNSLVVSIGVSAPIIDWGKGKGLVKVAESTREVIHTSVRQNQLEFEQNIYLKIREFNIQEDQFEIAAKADTIALMKYEVTKQRFLIGKIDVIELNIALGEKDQKRRAYIAALRNYWLNYYNIRKLTHYDFVNQQNIEADYDALMN